MSKAINAGPTGSVTPPRYETRSGCLFLSCVLLVLFGLSILLIVFFGNHAP